jgi:hypothetical protein
MIHFADGGPTSVDNGVLQCGQHHRQVHAEGWIVRLGSDRHPEFIPPAWIDPEQTPRSSRWRDALDRLAALRRDHGRQPDSENGRDP